MTKVARSLAALFVGALMSAALCAGQSAPKTGADRFEVSAVKAVRPTLVNTVAALKKGDVAGAKAAFEAYDSGWNGIEMYINTRDKSMYDELEKNLQERISKGLNSPSPDVAALTADAQTMLGKYDEAIAIVATAEPLNPLYDDMARLRIVRASLREVNFALKAGDVAKARKSLSVFSSKLGSVDGLLKARSPEASDAVAKGTAQLEAVLKSATPDIAQATTLLAGVLEKYNAVLAEINKDAKSR
jgi:hypothetical protein